MNEFEFELNLKKRVTEREKVSIGESQGGRGGGMSLLKGGRGGEIWFLSENINPCSGTDNQNRTMLQHSALLLLVIFNYNFYFASLVTRKC
jgi:hypothetical protein